MYYITIRDALPVFGILPTYLYQPILLYGAETWTLTRALEAKLDVFQR